MPTDEEDEDDDLLLDELAVGTMMTLLISSERCLRLALMFLNTSVSVLLLLFALELDRLFFSSSSCTSRSSSLMMPALISICSMDFSMTSNILQFKHK
jgi:hypothetical protein